MAFSGLGAVVSIGEGVGQPANQVMGGPAALRLLYSAMGFGVGILRAWCGDGVNRQRGWAAGQSGEGGPAALRLLYSAMGFGVWHSPLLGAVMISGYSVVTGSATV